MSPSQSCHAVSYIMKIPLGTKTSLVIQQSHHGAARSEAEPTCWPPCARSPLFRGGWLSHWSDHVVFVDSAHGRGHGGEKAIDLPPV